MDITGFHLLQAANSTGSLLTTFIPFGLVIVIFYFLIIRPQNKKQKDTERMLSALKKGDRIVTIGGVHGVIHAIKDGTVVVKVDENCKLEYSRSAIATVVVDKVEEPKKTRKSEKKVEMKEEIQSTDAPAVAVEANDEKK